MNRRITRIYILLLLIGIAYAVFSAMYLQADVQSRNREQSAVNWARQMEQTKRGSLYSYKTTLPKKDLQGKWIAFHSVHVSVDVLIDGHNVYSLHPKEGGKIKTTGYHWNFIHLSESDAAKEIEVLMKPAYTDITPISEFYYGTPGAVERMIVKVHFSQAAVAVAIAVVGLVLLFYVLFVVKEKQGQDVLFQLAVFSIMLGVWSVGESKIADMLFSGSLVIVCLSHLMLMTMTIPFALFLRQMYHNNRHPLWNIYGYMNCAIVAVRILLQLLGWKELRETLWMTHVSILLFIVVIIVLSVHEIVVNKLTRQVRLNICCAIILMASTLLQLGLYRIADKSTSIGSLGFLLYVVVMGIENVRNSRKVMEHARENEIYRKLAFTDELTGLYNRTAFKQDMDDRTSTDKIKSTTLFMADLNNLKQCNDTYGHEYGDQYIMMAAQAFKKVFLLDGKCYRIGGDEFCIMMSTTSKKEINSKLLQLERCMNENNRQSFVVEASMAVGYAVYDASADADLNDTMKRADKMMYEKKQLFKKQRG